MQLAHDLPLSVYHNASKSVQKWLFEEVQRQVIGSRNKNILYKLL